MEKGTPYSRSTDFRKLFLVGEGYRMEAFSSMFPNASDSMKEIIGFIINLAFTVVAVLASYGITKLLGIDSMFAKFVFYSIIATIGFIMVYWSLDFMGKFDVNSSVMDMAKIAYKIFMGSFIMVITILGAYTLVLVSLGKSAKVSSRNFFGGARFPY